MAGRFSVVTAFKATDRVTAPVTRMQNRVGKFTRKMSSGFIRVNRAVGKLNSKFKQMGKAAVASLVTLGFAFKNLLGAGANFEQAITNVGAVGLRTRDQIKPLEELALELGRTTQFTATQSANAMEELARSGFSVNEILATTPAVLAGAAASGLEIAEMALIVSKSLKGMELDLDKANEVVDVLAVASTKTSTTIGSLGESLKNVATTASEFKIPFNEVVAGVALLQDVGLDASVAGSAFNVMLTRMAVPTKRLQRVMQRFSISFKDAAGNMLPLPKVLEQLNIAGKKAGGNLDKVGFFAELVGLRGQKAALKLSKLFETGKFEELVEQLNNSRNAAQKMADLRMGTVTGSLLLLASAVDAVKVRIFELQSGPLKDTIDSFTKWVGVNKDLIATKVSDFILLIINNFKSIVKWTKRIAIGFAVFFTFSIILKTLAGVLALINLVMLANPITLIVLGVIAAIAAFTALVIWIDEAVASFENMPVGIQLLLSPLLVLIKVIQFVVNQIKGLIKIGRDLGAGFLFDLFGPGDNKKGEQKLLTQKKLLAQTKLLNAPGLTRQPDLLNIPDILRTSDVSKTPDIISPSGLSKIPDIISPQARVAKTIEETKQTTKTEVLIKTENGVRAEVTKGKLATGLTLQPSGAF